ALGCGTVVGLGGVPGRFGAGVLVLVGGAFTFGRLVLVLAHCLVLVGRRVAGGVLVLVQRLVLVDNVLFVLGLLGRTRAAGRLPALHIERVGRARLGEHGA